MKYISQLDYPHIPYITRTDMEGENLEKGKTTTVSSSGCGLCSAIMVADRLLTEYDFTLEDAIALSYETKANYRIGTAYSRFAPAFAEKVGLRLESSRNFEDLLRCLRTGGAAVVLVVGDRDGKVGLYTHGGHYMTAISEEADGRIAVLDPAYTEKKYNEPGREGRVEAKCNGLILCNPQDLAEECAPKPTPYHLFWRK